MRIHLHDIGCPFQRQVVHADENAVLCDLKVLLNVVGTFFNGKPIGLECVFWRISAEAPR